MRIITFDDFIDVYTKGKKRGLNFLLSKLSVSKNKRTQSAFDQTREINVNWWNVPLVRKRWNQKICGSSEKNHLTYLLEDLLANKKNLKLLSLGSGLCGEEMKMAQSGKFEEIICLDLSKYRMDQARARAKKEGLQNMKFINQAINKFDFPEQHFDIVFFRASLHHFKDVSTLLSEKVKNTLKPGGLVIINEYVGPNRMQYPDHQIKAINEALQMIPKPLKKRSQSGFYKNKFYGSGVLRMLIADPSECIESEKILPALHQHFEIVAEKPYGGNILANVLKDIAHHFIELNSENEKTLKDLFAFEDEYLKKNPSDYLFGVYRNEENRQH